MAENADRVLKKCDIVMKGGVTSGIVYPGAVCRLAENYRFHSIGGTSAGAIAAALTAAAEYARSQGRDVFSEVGKVPDWLGRKSEFANGSNLFNLFRPQRGVKGLFKFLSSFLIPGWGKRLVIWAQVFWLELLSGFVPGGILAWLASGGTGWRTTASIVLSILVGIAGAAVTAVLGLIIRIAKLPKFRYGLCTGYAPPKQNSPPALVNWLNEKLNALANKTPDQPLTFGDLKQANIDLQMITTCITFGRPYTLPFDSGEFYYSPSEMRLFFPPEVVDWMEKHPKRISDHGEPVQSGDLKALPGAEDLPVIVAARLSLSFPVLFCMAPLYAIDWTRRRRGPDEPAPEKRVPGDALAPDERRKPERVWFCDGGITSNFPLHLFDAPLPDWPTFGINLRDQRPDRTGSDDRIWTPRTNRAGIAQLWTRLGTDEGLAGTGKFVFGMIDAARNWVDNLQTMVPGYRDRIVHIYLDKKQGGLNLNMSEETVKALSGYGVQAGEKLVERFIAGTDDGQPTVMTWDNHRWIRFRSTIALLEEFLADFARSLTHAEPGDRTYFELLEAPTEQEPSYRFDKQQREDAEEFATGIEDVVVQMGGLELQNGAPSPRPALRVRPRY